MTSVTSADVDKQGPALMSERTASLPPTRRLVSRHVSRIIGGQPSVHAFYDEGERNSVAIVTCTGSPAPQLSTFSTASLHVAPNLLEGDDIRVELSLVAESKSEEAANVVATSAFNVMKDRWLGAPGVVFPDVVGEYFPRASTPHVMWTEPFVFPELSTVTLEGVEFDLHWLHGVPITEQERLFLVANGFDALSARLEAADASYYDLYRESVV